MFVRSFGSITRAFTIACASPSDLDLVLRGNKVVASQFPNDVFLEFVLESGKGRGKWKLPSVMNIVHTFVAPSGRNRGLAEAVTLHAFQHCIQKKMKVRPSCSYTRGRFLDLHPAFRDICVGLPSTTTTTTTLAPVPKRNKYGEFVFPDHPRFKPNLSPKQVLQMGSFGGTYFRPIASAITGTHFEGQYKELPFDWFEDLDIEKKVASANYDACVNKYGVKCGDTLDKWEKSGWIRGQDPYGWFQWYCRFYLGRRSADDDRQVGRALSIMSEKGRLRNQLISKCSRDGKAFDDPTLAPVIRQTLQHWGYQLTERDADEYVKSKNLPELPRPVKRSADRALDDIKKRCKTNTNE